MELLSWERELDKITSNCKWYPLITNLSIRKANRILQRAFYSSVNILGIDLKRGVNGEYLIQSN
ncbi:hypothetical protein SAMN04488010_1578 [Maribacter stanieri]|uniref:Uncharacterized protein n=1 Tax=Maribacter stanieri TaxID=440514 RepID=A0A1I6IEW2_9FLAO|nr:hypothetical protein SAMN04488010_1578 [Maribacter stanieri]